MRMITAVSMLLLLSLFSFGQEAERANEALELLPQANYHSLVFTNLERLKSAESYQLFWQNHGGKETELMQKYLPEQWVEHLDYLLISTAGTLIDRDKLQKRMAKLESKELKSGERGKAYMRLEKRVSRQINTMVVAGISELPLLLKGALKEGFVVKTGDNLNGKDILKFSAKGKFGSIEYFACCFDAERLLIAPDKKLLSRMILVGIREDMGLLDDSDYDVFLTKLNSLGAKWQVKIDQQLFPYQKASEREIGELESPGKEYLQVDSWALNDKVKNLVESYYLLEKHAVTAEQKRKSEPLSRIKFLPEEILKSRQILREAETVARVDNVISVSVIWDEELFQVNKSNNEETDGFLKDYESKMRNSRGRSK